MTTQSCKFDEGVFTFGYELARIWINTAKDAPQEIDGGFEVIIESVIPWVINGQFLEDTDNIALQRQIVRLLFDFVYHVALTKAKELGVENIIDLPDFSGEMKKKNISN